MRKVKIIATLGPSSWEEGTIKELLRAGADGFRVNFSHGDRARWRSILKAVRSLDDSVPLIGDLQGPVIRLGEVEPFEVRKGDEVIVMNSDKGDREVPIPGAELFRALEEGDVLLIEGGRMVLAVEEMGEGRARCRALVDGRIEPRKTVAIRGKELPLPTLTRKDVSDLKFAVEAGFDYIALSFVKSGGDVEKLRRILVDLGGEWMRVVAKIETRRAVENIREIAEVADAVLVARGDLAIYYNLEEIPRVQSRIVRAVRGVGKPVIIATQLLSSMTRNPLPTRSEVVDVISAVREGADALLLADETAVGSYPVRTVEWLNRIVREAEGWGLEKIEPEKPGLYELVAKGVVTMAELIDAIIIAYSESGTTAKRLSMYRPSCDVYVFTRDRRVLRQMKLLWGITPLMCELEKDDPRLFSRLLELVKERGLASYGDIIVFTAGVREGTTDIVRVERVVY